MSGEWADVPLDRLDELMRLGHIELGRGSIISHPTMQSHPGSYPVYSSSILRNGHIGSYGKYDFDEELVTWSVDGGGNFFHRPRHKFSITNVSGYLKIRDDKKYNYKYLYYMLSHQHGRLQFDYTLKAHPSVIKTVYVIPRLSLAEQRRIAAILDTLDRTIEGTQRVIEKLQATRQGLLHDLLTRGLDENGGLRDPERNPEQFKETELGRVPVGWEVQRLTDVAQRITKGTTPTTYGRDYVNSGINFIRIENLTKGGHVDLAEVFYIDEHTNRFLRRSQLQAGDLLISIAGSIGRTAVVNASVIPANTNQAVAIVRLHQGRVNAHFLRMYLATPQGQKALLGSSVQLAQANLNLEQVGLTVIPLPPLVEQNRVVVALDAQEGRIHAETTRMTKLQALKRGLMEDLLTGRVRVPVADAEVGA